MEWQSVGKKFIGQYVQKLDAKHRVVVPRALREAIGDDELRAGLFLTRGLDQCLFLFPASKWDAVAEEIAAADLRGFNARMVQRLFFGDAVQADPDKLGRVRLPERLRQLAGIEGQVLFLGASNRIELWNPQRWAALRSAHEAQFEELAESLYQLRPGQGPKP